MYKKYFYHKIDSTQLEIWRRIEENKIEVREITHIIKGDSKKNISKV